MDFELLVFTTDPAKAQLAVQAGAAAIVVDWENKGKASRQAGADTEINHFGPAELERLRQLTTAKLICRVNGTHSKSREEIDCAIQSGAHEILFPMVRRVDEVERLLEWTRGRCRAGVLIETVDAVAVASRIASLGLHRIYVGLNDLAIERGSRSIFDAVVDGTLDQIRDDCAGTPFGFGGLTIPEGGSPIPCRLVRGEIVRLDCSFTFARRSFWRDMHGRDLLVEIPRILESVAAARLRLRSQVEQDRDDFRQAVELETGQRLQCRAAVQ